MENIFATEKLKSLLPRVKEFVERELIPLEKGFSHHRLTETIKILDQKREKVKAEGLWGLHLPISEGGLGLTLCEFGQLSEALAYAYRKV